MRDPSKFRLRFKEYKEGKSVREIYGLPGYEPGKLPVEEMMPYILAVENPTKQGLVNGVWRPPTDSTKWDVHAIGGGLDIREQHNPIVYNYLKTNGRLANPFLTAREEEVLREKVFKKTMLPALQNVYNKYGDKISSKGYARLAGMKWQGHPFLMAISPDSVTGKAFIKAIESGDKDLDSVFDAYYKYPANAKRYAARILADTNYWKNHNTVATKPVPQEPIIAVPDATRVATIPTIQQKAIDYSDRRNAVAAEAERAMWAHNVMEDMRGAYQVPIWESSSLPALTPVEYDVTPFRYNNGKLPGYQNGTILQGHKQIPIDNARTATEPDYTKDGWLLGTLKRGANNFIKTVEYFTDSARRVLNGRGSTEDKINVALDLGGAAGVKAISKIVRSAKVAKAAKNTIKPKTVIPETATPSETGAILDAHPELYRTVDMTIPKLYTKQFYESDIKPKWESRGVDIGFDPDLFTLQGADFGNSKLAAIMSERGKGYVNYNLAPEQLTLVNLHEVDGHALENILQEAAKTNPLIRNYLLRDALRVENAWKYPDWFLEQHKGFPVVEESKAVIREFRGLHGLRTRLSGNQLMLDILNLPDDKFKRLMENTNAYTKAVVSNPDVDLKKLKDTIAYIPGLAVAVAKAYNNGEFSNGKLPGYSNGKIRIKPSKRGTFTAAAKKHGASVREFESRVLKNPEKYSKAMVKKARFSRNARSWKH